MSNHVIERGTLIEQARQRIADYFSEHIRRKFPEPTSPLKLRIEVNRLCRRFGCAEGMVTVEVDPDSKSMKLKVPSAIHTLSLAAAIEEHQKKHGAAQQRV